MNGIALGTRLGFAVCVLLMMPVLLPVACAESLRQRLAGAWTMAASRGRVLSRSMPMADIIVLMTLLLSLSATGCWIAGGDSQTALAAMVFAATVTAVCACCAVVLLSFVTRSPIPESDLASLFSSHRCAPRSNAIVLFRRHVDTHLCDVLVSP